LKTPVVRLKPLLNVVIVVKKMEVVLVVKQVINYHGGSVFQVMKPDLLV
jgi:hypothetical protein